MKLLRESNMWRYIKNYRNHHDIATFIITEAKSLEILFLIASSAT